MLINNTCSIIQSLKVELVFDNDLTKERELSVGDLCSFTFVKDGMKREIEGKIVKISMNSSSNSKSWYIIVDGSFDYAGQQVRFCPDNILDCDIIRRHDDKQYVSTTNDESRITNIRLMNSCLQVSSDGGYSWFTPRNARILVNDDGDRVEDDPRFYSKAVEIEPSHDDGELEDIDYAIYDESV